MGENDALKLQNIMEELRDLIDHKDCEIARWKEKEKEAFDMGFSEGHEVGMKKASLRCHLRLQNAEGKAALGCRLRTEQLRMLFLQAP